MTAAQKEIARQQFEANFSMDSRAASELFGSAAHLLAAPQLLDSQLTKLAHKNSSRFSKEQVDSLIDMMTRVASADGELSSTQEAFISEVRSKFVRQEHPQGTWA